MDPDMMGEMGGGGEPQGAAPMPADPGAKDPGMGEEGGIVHIPMDMLPKECQDCKAGDMLTFKCVGPADSEGDLPLEYASHKAGAEGGESWESDFRKEMSPRNKDEGDGMGGGY